MRLLTTSQAGSPCTFTWPLCSVSFLLTDSINHSLAATFHRPLHRLDIQNAFWHGDLKEGVYMEQPLALLLRGRLVFRLDMVWSKGERSDVGHGLVDSVRWLVDVELTTLFSIAILQLVKDFGLCMWMTLVSQEMIVMAHSSTNCSCRDDHHSFDASCYTDTGRGHA